MDFLYNNNNNTLVNNNTKLLRWSIFLNIHYRGALNEGGVSKIGDFQNLSRHITETVQDGLKLLLITNRNVYMRFPLVPKSMTLSQWPDPGFKVTVGKIGDFWPLSRQYLKNGWS